MKMNKVSRPDKKNKVEFCVRAERRTHVNSKENQNRPVSANIYTALLKDW